MRFRAIIVPTIVAATTLGAEPSQAFFAPHLSMPHLGMPHLGGVPHFGGLPHLGGVPHFGVPHLGMPQAIPRLNIRPTVSIFRPHMTSPWAWRRSNLAASGANFGARNITNSHEDSRNGRAITSNASNNDFRQTIGSRRDAGACNDAMVNCAGNGGGTVTQSPPQGPPATPWGFRNAPASNPNATTTRPSPSPTASVPSAPVVSRTVQTIRGYPTTVTQYGDGTEIFSSPYVNNGADMNAAEFNQVIDGAAQALSGAGGNSALGTAGGVQSNNMSGSGSSQSSDGNGGDGVISQRTADDLTNDLIADTLEKAKAIAESGQDSIVGARERLKAVLNSVKNAAEKAAGLDNDGIKAIEQGMHQMDAGK